MNSFQSVSMDDDMEGGNLGPYQERARVFPNMRTKPYTPLENDSNDLLSKMLLEKTRELRQLKGEELQGLDMDELIKVEKRVLGVLNHVVETKNDKYFKEINMLVKKESKLMEENDKLKQQAEKSEVTGDGIEQSNSSECITNSHGSDTSLRLGLPFSN